MMVMSAEVGLSGTMLIGTTLTLEMPGLRTRWFGNVGPLFSDGVPLSSFDDLAEAFSEVLSHEESIVVMVAEGGLSGGMSAMPLGLSGPKTRSFGGVGLCLSDDVPSTSLKDLAEDDFEESLFILTGTSLSSVGNEQPSDCRG